MYQLVMMKNKDEFIKGLPSHWVSSMNKYFGATIVVETNGFDYWTRNRHWCIGKSDIANVILEDINPNNYVDIGVGDYSEWSDSEPITFPHPYTEQSYGLDIGPGKIEFIEPLRPTTLGSSYSGSPTRSPLPTPRNRLLLL